MTLKSPTDYTILFVRAFAGGHFALSGLNYFFGWVAQPVSHMPLSAQYVAIITKMGLFTLVKVIESIVGICLLMNWFVPLIVVIGFPVTVNIFFNNAIVVHDGRQIYTGTRGLLIDLFLFAAYARYYLPLTTFNAKPAPIWKMLVNRSLAVRDGALVDVGGMEAGR